MQADDIHRRRVLAAADIRACTSDLLGVDTDGAGYAAHNKIGMRILATEDGVQLGHVALPGQGFQIMSDRHQVGFRRQLVGRVAPIAIGEYSQLA